MIDPVSAAVVLASLGVGWLVGRHGRIKSAPKQPQPVCLCGHHYGTHAPDSGACEVLTTERRQSKPGGYYGDFKVRCACVRYTGPQPVEQYWVPPSADLSIVTAPRVRDEP